MSSLAEFGRRQSAKLLTLTRPQAIVLLIGSLLCAGVWIASATGHPAAAVALLAAVLGVLLVGVLHLSRWIGGVHRANQLAVLELRTVVEQLQRRLVAAAEADRIVAGERHAELAAARRDERRGPELLLRQQSREIEALFQLFDGFTPRAPMPSSGGVALNPTDLLALLHLIRTRQPRLVLELGSGTSSVWIGYAVERYGGRLVSVDHDHGHAQRTRAQLVAHGLDTVAAVRDAPLTGVPVGGSTYQWYDPAAVADLRDVDMVLVDGPAEAAGPGARFPALHVLERRLAATATIVVDAASGEQDTIPGLSPERTLLGRHAVLGYTRAERPMAASTP